MTYSACALGGSIDYVWTDPTDAETTNSSYTFNIGTNVQNPPAACGGANAIVSPAYQVTANGGGLSCLTAGYDLTKRPSLFSQALFDGLNPARGWSLTYSGGQSSGCPNGISRSFTINFICGRGPFPAPGATSASNMTFIDEENSCQYSAYVRAISNCPAECINPADGSLCNNAGVCGYDSALSAARCYCNNNYNETYCVDPVASVPSGAIAGATIGGILVGVFVVLVVPLVMWYSSRNGGSSASSASVAVPGEGFYGDGSINQ